MKRLASLLFILFFFLLGAFSAPRVFAQEACGITAGVTKDASGKFFLDVSISQSQLIADKQYQIEINTGLISRPRQPFVVRSDQISQQLRIGPLDSGYTGNTYEVYIRASDMVEVVGATTAICKTQVYFDPKAPPMQTTTLAPVPKQPTIGLFCDPGKKFVKTALGCIPTDPSAFIGKLLSIGIGLAGGIAFLLILFGGFQILTSAGNPEQLNAGKELVGSAIAGLLLIIFSIFILRVIGVNILGIPGFK